MNLTSEGRKRLLKLLVIQDMSQREFAAAIGWGSHSYAGRLLRGEVTTVKPATAARIAEVVGVNVTDLFAPKVTTASAHTTHQQGAAA